MILRVVPTVKTVITESYKENWNLFIYTSINYFNNNYCFRDIIC